MRVAVCPYGDKTVGRSRRGMRRAALPRLKNSLCRLGRQNDKLRRDVGREGGPL